MIDEIYGFRIGKGNPPNSTSFTTNPTLIDLGLNPSRWGGKKANKFPSYGRAQK
jgi:hypothetical protein